MKMVNFIENHFPSETTCHQKTPNPEVEPQRPEDPKPKTPKQATKQENKEANGKMEGPPLRAKGADSVGINQGTMEEERNVHQWP